VTVQRSFGGALVTDPVTGVLRRRFVDGRVSHPDGGMSRSYAAAGGAAGGAPAAAYLLGSQVGVPTGTTLTPTVGLPAADASENYLLTHPVGGATADRPVSVWENRSWSSTLTVTPPAGETYLFRNCQFENTADNWCVEIVDTNYTPDQMVPLAIFDRCTFDGNDTCGRALLAGCVWLVDCHLTGAEDAWGGGYYSVAIGTNYIPTTDGGFDPHQDGVQLAGIGDMTMYRCFASGGTDPASNAGLRLGTDFSAIANVELIETTFDGGGWSLQVRGDPGDRGVTALTVAGCRWTGSAPKGAAGFGPVDFEQVTGVTWTDNRFLGDDVEIPVPA
jgi:hypothetical protein